MSFYSYNIQSPPDGFMSPRMPMTYRSDILSTAENTAIKKQSEPFALANSKFDNYMKSVSEMRSPMKTNDPPLLVLEQINESLRQHGNLIHFDSFVTFEQIREFLRNTPK